MFSALAARNNAFTFVPSTQAPPIVNPNQPQSQPQRQVQGQVQGQGQGQPRSPRTYDQPPPYHPGFPQRYDFNQMFNRPALPEEHRNPFLRTMPDEINIVKFQTIVREDKEIIVGRIKVPTPVVQASTQPHAFVLRRYDTDAISLTTMFKVAFPGASDDDEKKEHEHIKSSYEIGPTNGGAHHPEIVKLAGTWINRTLAIHIAPAYGLELLIAALARAVPDPNVAYRRSLRSQVAHDESHQRENGTDSEANPTPTVPSMTAADTTAPIPKRARRDIATPTPGATSTNTANDQDRQITLEATNTITAPAGALIDMQAEIASAKQLVLDLKRELQLRNANGRELEETGQVDVAESSSRGIKRNTRGDDSVELSSGAGAVDRVVRRNNRVVVQQGAAETAKKVAWSAFVFGLGAGAALLIPQFTTAFL